MLLKKNLKLTKLTCYNCQKIGHTTRVCTAAKSKIQSISSISEAPTHEVKLWVDQKWLKMDLDTGACTTAISEAKYFEYFSHIQLKIFSKTLFSVSGENLQILGKILVDVEYQNTVHKLELVIVKSHHNVMPLLGRDWLDILMPKWRSY